MEKEIWGDDGIKNALTFCSGKGLQSLASLRWFYDCYKLGLWGSKISYNHIGSNFGGGDRFKKSIWFLIFTSFLYGRNTVGWPMFQGGVTRGMGEMVGRGTQCIWIVLILPHAFSWRPSHHSMRVHFWTIFY